MTTRRALAARARYDETDLSKAVPVVMKGFCTEWTAMAAACEARSACARGCTRASVR